MPLTIGTLFGSFTPFAGVLAGTSNLSAIVQPGQVELSAGLIDPKTQQAKVSFAAREQFSDRWLPLEGFAITE